MDEKGKFLAAGVAAGALFGIGLAVGMLLGSRWERLVRGLREHTPLGRQQVRYGVLQQ